MMKSNCQSVRVSRVVIGVPNVVAIDDVFSQSVIQGVFQFLASSNRKLEDLDNLSNFSSLHCMQYQKVEMAKFGCRRAQLRHACPFLSLAYFA